MNINEYLWTSMSKYGIYIVLVDDDYTFCIAKHLLLMPLHLKSRNSFDLCSFSLNHKSRTIPLVLYTDLISKHKFVFFKTFSYLRIVKSNKIIKIFLIYAVLNPILLSICPKFMKEGMGSKCKPKCPNIFCPK